MEPSLIIVREVFGENCRFEGDNMPKYGITSRMEKENELTLEKIFEVPRERLFEMFSKSEHLESFWGPRGWELIHSSMDFKEGGEWFYGMQDTDSSQDNYGMKSWGMAVYEEIVEPEKLVYVDYFTDKSGEINRELPVAKTVVTFDQLDEERSVLISRTEYQSEEELQKLVDAGMLQGIAETWDRLSEYLEKNK